MTLGCTVLSDPSNAECAKEHVTADVVFVHGIRGDSIKTWTHHGKSGTAVCWPEHLLPSSVRHIRVITFGYDADIIKLWGTAGQNNINEHGNSLITYLANERRETRTSGRPIIFVGHSMGGLVIEAALVSSYMSADPDLCDISSSTAGIIFMGTPHCGSDLAAWGITVGNLVRYFGSCNRKLMKGLKPTSEVLSNVEEAFFQWVEKRRASGSGTYAVQIENFFEARPVNFIVGKVVPNSSSKLKGFHNQSIDANHMEMVRFPNKEEPGYRLVSGKIRRWVDLLEEAAAESRKDAVAVRAELGSLSEQVSAINAALGPSTKEEVRYFSTALDKHKTRTFIGRQGLISEIHEKLAGVQVGERVLVLQGMGGIGKTQAAIRYSNLQCRETEHYRMTFWIDASNQRTAAASFSAIVNHLGPPSAKGLEPAQQVEYLCRYLGERSADWLMVMDNLDCPRKFDDVREFMPGGNASHILITSRHRDTNLLGTAIEVGGMSDEEAIELLFNKCGKRYPPGSDEFSDCEVIMHNFGNLPLAIAQAGSYMGARRITPQRFLASYRRNRATILDYCPRLLDYKVHVSGDETGCERIISAFTTWELSLCEIDTPGSSNQKEKNPFLKIPATELKPPAQLLLLSAFFDHTGISELLFETAALAVNSHCPAWLTGSCVVHGMWNNDRFLDIVQELSSLSLIEKREDDPKDPDGPTVYSLHPLVQEWAKLRLDPDERQAYFLQSIWILADFLDPDSYEETQIQSKTLILQNLDEILKNDDELRMQGLPPLLAVRELIEVALRFASYYLDHGHYKEARSLYKKVIERNQPAKGIDPPKALQLDFLHAEEGIAITDLLEANYDQAAKRCAGVVDGYTRLLGKDSHERLRALRNLAEIHGGQGDYSDVVSLYTEVVTTFERTVGPDHLITLREVEGLGNAHRVNKQYSQAAEHYCRALAGMERLLPPKHPDLLGIVEGLGIVRQGQKRYKDAEQLFTRALKGNEDTIGPDHPDTLNTVEELGNLWAEQGRLDVAKPFYERARDGRCLLLGMNHPDSQRTIRYLAELEAALTVATNIPVYHETPFYPWYRSVSDYAEAMEFRKSCDNSGEVQDAHPQ